MVHSQPSYILLWGNISNTEAYKITLLRKIYIVLWEYTIEASDIAGQGSLLKFVYFWLCWVFAAAQAFLELCRAGLRSSCSEQTYRSGSCCRAQAVGLSSCGSWARETRLSSCGTWAQLLRGMWELPRPGIEPVSPALAGRFFTTEPPGKPLPQVFKIKLLKEIQALTGGNKEGDWRNKEDGFREGSSELNTAIKNQKQHVQCSNPGELEQ